MGSDFSGGLRSRSAQVSFKHMYNVGPVLLRNNGTLVRPTPKMRALQLSFL